MCPQAKNRPPWGCFGTPKLLVKWEGRKMCPQISIFEIWHLYVSNSIDLIRSAPSRYGLWGHFQYLGCCRTTSRVRFQKVGSPGVPLTKSFGVPKQPQARVAYFSPEDTFWILISISGYMSRMVLIRSALTTWDHLGPFPFNKTCCTRSYDTSRVNRSLLTKTKNAKKYLVCGIRPNCPETKIVSEIQNVSYSSAYELRSKFLVRWMPQTMKFPTHFDSSW